MAGMQVAKNSIIKFISLFATLIIELFFARFLIKHLGSDVYGLVLLSTNIVAFAEIIKIIFVSTMGRYSAIAIHQKKKDVALRTYNVSVIGCAILTIFILLPVFGVIAWKPDFFFNLPQGSESQAKILFATVFLSFAIILNSSAMSIGTFVHNRLDLNDVVSLTRIIVSRALTFILICYAGYKLNGLSLGIASGAIVVLLSSLYLCKKLTPELFISTRFWDKKLFWSMNSFGGWIALRQLGSRIMVFLDILIVNWLYGASQAGFFAIAVFFSSKLRLLTGSFSVLLNPVILKRHALGDIDGVMDTAVKSVRIIGITFALPVGLLCGLYGPILTVWVGPEYQRFHWLAVILTCHISVNTSCYPLFAIEDAYGKVKIPGLVAIFFSIFFVGLAYLLAMPVFHLGVKGVAIAGFVSITANHAIFTPYYVSKIQNRPPTHLYKAFLPGLVGLCLASTTGYFMAKLTKPDSLLELGSVCLTVSTCYVLFTWYYLFGDFEKKIVAQLLNRLPTNRNIDT